MLFWKWVNWNVWTFDSFFRQEHSDIQYNISIDLNAYIPSKIYAHKSISFFAVQICWLWWQINQIHLTPLECFESFNLILIVNEKQQQQQLPLRNINWFGN